MNNPDYSKLDNDTFDSLLRELVGRSSAASLLDIGDVYSQVSEHFNNDVLELWEQRNPDLAYPNGKDEDEG